MKCPDCKDGLYYPLFGSAEPCSTCNGTQEVCQTSCQDEEDDLLEDEDEEKIKIGNDTLVVHDVRDCGGYAHIDTDDGEYYVFATREHAEEITKEYWLDMAENAPKEFACIVGSDTLIAWALGRSSSGASCLEDWLDLVGNEAECHLASYDGEERDVELIECEELEDILGDDLKYCVAYRTN